LSSYTPASIFSDATDEALLVRLATFAGFVSANDFVEVLFVLERLRGFDVVFLCLVSVFMPIDSDLFDPSWVT
jgi:hypothetical protein